MMVDIVTGRLLDHSLYEKVCEFVCSQGVHSSETVGRFAQQNACFAAGLDGDTVVGTSLNFSNANTQYLEDKIGTYLSNNGITLSECVSPVGVFVNPDYRDQGLGDKLSVAKSQFSINDGYVYTVLWGYESQAIFDYSTRIGNLIDTGVDDMYGYRIYLRRLTDVVSALSEG